MYVTDPYVVLLNLLNDYLLPSPPWIQLLNSLRPARLGAALGMIILQALVALLIASVIPFAWKNDVGSDVLVTLDLKALDIPGRKPLATYRVGFEYQYQTLPSPSHEFSQDTTVVLLNWSRFSNVILIASSFCASSLDIISEIYIWNNNPNVTLVHENFRSTGCPSDRIRLFNSPLNLYFQARFLACSESETPYCFIQDDDYVVRPEVFRNMRLHLSPSAGHRVIHLLPPHEHLTSRLREIHDENHTISTSFAWLGHGTYMSRSEATQFLSRALFLNLTNEEMKMADNYFTILMNQVPEIWFDHGIELGGGQPFTVGIEGDDRNKRHIEKALQYLEYLARQNVISSSQEQFHDHSVNRAPCRLSTCLLETSIGLLPGKPHYVANRPGEMLSVEEMNREAIGDGVQQLYISHPLSHAVDGWRTTAFRSPQGAVHSEALTLDLLGQMHIDDRTLELVILVDIATERILRQCEFATSVDGAIWDVIPEPIVCFDIPDDEGEQQMRECSVQVQTPRVQSFRATFTAERSLDKWCIFEIWVRLRVY